MSGSVLDDPESIYRPFSREESAVLRAFVADVRRLGAMRFFTEVPQTATQRFGEEGMASEMDEPDDEAVRAAITQFRQIYNPHEPHSFKKAIDVLKASANDRDGPHRDEAITLLKGHQDAARKAVQMGIGLGIAFERPDGVEDVGPREIIDAYFHGHYLHSGNSKSELARRLDALQPWPRYTLYTVMGRLRNVYWQAANAADRVLSHPSLLDA
jgi:hypothetical protein